MSGGTSESQEEKEKQNHLMERSYAHFERSFRLPDGVDRDKIFPNFENGLLIITLPRSENSLLKTKRREMERK